MRPRVVLSCAVSLDGYLDDATATRLVLSSAADLDRVDAERAASDAILVGAATVRRDDPRLLLRAEHRRRERRDHGRPPDPTKVTLTGTGDLPAGAAFFTAGTATKLVYCPRPVRAAVAAAVGDRATVVAVGAGVELPAVLADLAGRGVGRLLVEGGGRVLTQFLAAGLADELHLVVAPFLVGDPAAPRFLGPGRFPWSPERPMELADVTRLGDLVLLRYRLPPAGPADAVPGG